MVVVEVLVLSILRASVYILLAVGFSLIYRTVRYFHLAHGAIYALGAYLTWWLHVSIHLPLPWAVLLAALCSALVGCVIDLLCYEPLLRRGAPRLSLLLMSFGLLLLVQNALQLAFGVQALSLRTGAARVLFNIGRVVVTTVDGVILAASCILTVAFFIMLANTRIGVTLSAVACDRIAARLIGIQDAKIVVVVYGIGSFLAGTAGGMVSLQTNVSPYMGFGAVLKAIVICILGGLGNVYGAIVGSIVLAIIETTSISIIGGGWSDGIVFGLMIGILIFAPGGLFPSAHVREQ